LLKTAVAGGGNRNSIPHLDDSFPGTSFLRIKEFIDNE
jgi:hypothetical protein